jgi:hypothetical protein
MGYGNYTITSATVDDSLISAGAVDSIAVGGEGDAWFFLEAAVVDIGEVAVL